MIAYIIIEGHFRLPPYDNNTTATGRTTGIDTATAATAGSCYTGGTVI